MEWRTDNEDDDDDDGIHVPSLNLIYKFMLVNFAENRIAIAMKIQRDGSNRPKWSFQCAMLAIEPPANLKLSTQKCNTIRVWIDINRNLLSNGKPFFWLCIRCSQARIVIICTLLRYFVRASCLRHKRCLACVFVSLQMVVVVSNFIVIRFQSMFMCISLSLYAYV